MENIETQMAKYMNQPITTVQPLSPALVKVSGLLDRFVSKYGSVQIEIFRLPDCPGETLQRFLNSLQITLRRYQLICSYVWQYVPSEQAYSLFVFHYSPAIGSISSVVHRLWHTLPSVVQINNIQVDSSNCASVKDWLHQLLPNESSSAISYRRHSYGSSFTI